jgi:hypothetical protein
MVTKTAKEIPVRTDTKRTHEPLKGPAPSIRKAPTRVQTAPARLTLTLPEARMQKDIDAGVMQHSMRQEFERDVKRQEDRGGVFLGPDSPVSFVFSDSEGE